MHNQTVAGSLVTHHEQVQVMGICNLACIFCHLCIQAMSRIMADDYLPVLQLPCTLKATGKAS